MRLLICTQAVDERDPVLGFFCRWIAELAQRYEHIHVICLKEGTHTLPANVSVHSLGKELGVSRVKYLSRFFKYLWELRHVDAVFVHMNEEYVLLGGIFWRFLGKELGLWRNHKIGSWRTRLAVRIASVVFHTSPHAYVTYSRKAVLMPIGIDTDAFSPSDEPAPNTILFLGRLDPVKKPEVFLEAMQEVVKTHPDARVDVYGDPTPGHEGFAHEVKSRFESLPGVAFYGAVSNDMAPSLYRAHAVYVNTTPSGSFDKTIGEAMASGSTVIAANAAVAPVLGGLFIDSDNSEQLARTIAQALDMDSTKRNAFAAKAREYVVKNHSLALLVERVFDSLGQSNRIHYVVNARMPSRKAYGIQIAKMCEALIEAGARLTLVIPNTSVSTESLRSAYGLRVDVQTVRIPTPDWYTRGRLAFAFASLWFACASFAHLCFARLAGTVKTVYTIDMDTFSFVPYPLFGASVIAEMHEGKRATFGKRFFFRRARGIVATNTEIRDSLCSAFGMPDEQLLVEPNGVDMSAYDGATKEEARKELALSDAPIALYVGRFYAWKGLEVIAEAAQLAPKVSWFLVGGDAHDFKRATGIEDIPRNLHLAGIFPPSDIPKWLAAADVLVVAGTKKNERSFRYTSPMKLFEYMAAKRPIVASKTPALTSIVEEGAATWYEPDDATDLARAVAKALQSDATVGRAYEIAREHTWSKRAERILEFIARQTA